MQRHKVKLILKKNKKNALGQLPIYIRITMGGKANFISTGYYIMARQWDEKYEQVKGHPLQNEINNDITHRKREVLGTIVDAGYKKQAVTAEYVKEQATQKGDLTNIFEFADSYREEMSDKREGGTTENWRKHLKKLEEYHGSRSLHFEAITPAYLNTFERHLRNGGIKSPKGKDPGNYIHAIMKSIRRMFTAAAGKKLITCYPFGEGGYELPEATPDTKDSLTLEELDKLEKFADETTNARYRTVATWFLFGCYTGLRVSDWYQFDFSKHYHRTYISIKTIKTGGIASVPMNDRLKRALDRCRKAPLDTWEQDLNENIKLICKELKIKKSPTTHSGRKTFAVTMCAERGISSETCAHMLAITLDVCVKSYYRVTPEKVRRETEAAWKGI